MHPLAESLQPFVAVKPLTIDAEKFWHYYQTNGYEKIYPPEIPHIEKSLEHFVSLELLQPARRDLFVDVASQGSPVPEIVKRTYGCKVLRQDLSYPPGRHGEFIGSDAGNIPLPDNSVTCMTLHCSFEHFEGDADTRFIREAERLLKPGGKVCSLPLYMKDNFRNYTDPSTTQGKPVFDEGAEIVPMPIYGNRFGRHYSPVKLKERIIDHLGTLHAIVYVVNNNVHPQCYLTFILLLEKPS